MGAPPVGAFVEVSVPASTANLGPGFDAVALALDVRDRYAVHVTASPGLVVELHGEGAGQLPADDTHLVARALRAAMEVSGAGWVEQLADRGRGLRLECHNQVPMSAGLGSSATAVVGGLGLGFALAAAGPAAGTRTLWPDGLSDAERSMVNTHAGVWEGHPDNSSASVFGGLTLSWMPSAQVVRTVRLRVHADVEPVVLWPRGDRLSTSTARAVLPSHVPHGDAVRQAGRSALLVHALTCEPALLWDATCDWLHQEQRRTAYPGSMAAVDTLRALGHPAVVSGAGPTVLVLVRRGLADTVRAEVRGWGPDWRVLRPGVAEHGLVCTRG